MIEKSRISDYNKVKNIKSKDDGLLKYKIMKGEVVMKRMYEKPMAYEEVFKANEYIALISNTTKLRVIQDYVY